MPHRILLGISVPRTTRGCVARYKRMLCLALEELSAPLNLRVQVVVQESPSNEPTRAGESWEHVEFVPVHGKFGVARSILSLAATWRPDLLLLDSIGWAPLGWLSLPFVSRGFGFVAHGPECRREDLLCERRASRLAAARRASFVFATSRDTGRDLCELTGLAARSIRPLPHTVDPDFIGSDDGCSLAGDESVVEFLTVSRHGSEESLQGLDQALRSFASLAPRHPRARYRIVCERNGTELLRRVATSLGVGHRVIFEQDLDESELAQRYRRSAAFVLPRGFEDSGIRFLEAMGFARACVGCDQDGSAEVIVDGETGFLVRFGDAVRLTSVLERLLASPELCRDLGLAGRQRLIEQFTFEQFRARLEAHLGELLGLH